MNHVLNEEKKSVWSWLSIKWTECIGNAEIERKKISQLLGLEMVVRNYEKWWFCLEVMGI